VSLTGGHPKQIAGVLSRPMEHVITDVPDDRGVVGRNLGWRGEMKHACLERQHTTEFIVPARGLIGFRGGSDADGGRGFPSQFHGYDPYKGDIAQRIRERL
jgi:predicted membrane GTPase involved in stress response